MKARPVLGVALALAGVVGCGDGAGDRVAAGWAAVTTREGGGALLASFDGGQTWAVRYSAERPLSSVDFVDERNGWAGGRDQLLRTRDGGASWQPVTTLPVPYPLVGTSFGVSFGSPAHGVVAGSVGEPRPSFVCWVTTDGGDTWTDCLRREQDGETSPGGGGSCWLSPTTSLAETGGAIYRGEGGSIWSYLSMLPGGIDAHAGACDDGTAWFAGAETVSRDPFIIVPAVARSDDGGNTWLDLEAVRRDVDLWAQFNSVAAHGRANVWIAGTRYDPMTGAPMPWIIASANGGTTWGVQPLPGLEEGELVTITFLDSLVGAVGGVFASEPDRGVARIFFTDDGGSTWQPALLPTKIGALGVIQLAPD